MNAFFKKIAIRVIALLVLSGFISWRGTEYLDSHHFKVDFKIADLLQKSAEHDAEKNKDNLKKSLKLSKAVLPVRKKEKTEDKKQS